MKIVAITKTFRGEELCIESLNSIYNHVDKIIYLHSDISWLGDTGNTVCDIIKKHEDQDRKIVNIIHNTKSQDEQYKILFEEANKFNPDWIMMIDTDEVWDDDQMVLAIKTLKETNKNINAIKTSMISHIKSPHYQITPEDALKPTVFVRGGQNHKGCRGNEITPSTLVPTIHFHHFCSVRKSLQDVIHKHYHSCGVENDSMADMEIWVNNIWNKLPNSKNLLPLKGHEQQWKAVKVVKTSDLPAAMHNSKLVKSFEKYIYKNIVAPQKIDDKEPQKIVQKMVNRSGSFCITTTVDKNYKWYIPMFVYSINKHLPNIDIKVFVYEDSIEDIMPFVVKTKNSDGSNVVNALSIKNVVNSKYNIATLRFLHGDQHLDNYDYVLITDVDMLMYKENYSIVDTHMRQLDKDGTICYENWITDGSAQNPRMPGVHFVTKQWWAETRKAREHELSALKKIIEAYDHDERTIGRIVINSGLPLPMGKTAAKLWRHHGVHIGDWRMSVDRKQERRVNVDEQMHIYALINDPEFMKIFNEATKFIPYLKKIFGNWKMIFN